MKRYLRVLMIFLFACMLVGCGAKEKAAEEGDYYLYYTNVEETGLEREAYDAGERTTEGLILELLDALKEVPGESSHINLLTDEIKIDDYEYENTNVTLNMSDSYSAMSRTKEVLVRAGLVRTLVRIDGVDSVTILVVGEPLKDSKGEEIGPLYESSFIENSGKEINSYVNTTLKLYFADSEGLALLTEEREIYYSSNVPLERVVVEQVVKGPKSEGLGATVATDTKVLGVTVVDGICYVNLSKEFADHTLNVTQEIPIYSIVNSLVMNCSVKKVQISVEGESDFIFRESMELNQPYEKKLDLVQKPQE